MEKTDGPKKSADSHLKLSWAKVRKFETLVFMVMFLAVPLFAFRVISYTQAQLLVRNATRELVQDLHRSKKMAVSNGQEVTLTAVKPMGARLSNVSVKKTYRYVIKSSTGVIEEVLLPQGLSITGTVSFDPEGVPAKPSSFILTCSNRTATVEIDREGMVSVP